MGKEKEGKEILEAAKKHNQEGGHQIEIKEISCLNKIFDEIASVLRNPKEASLREGCYKKIPNLKKVKKIIILPYDGKCVFKKNLFGAGGRVLILPIPKASL